MRVSREPLPARHSVLRFQGRLRVRIHRHMPLRHLMKLRHLWPLVGFVVPTVVIGYGFVIPRSPIAGVNDLTIGFATTILGACVTYVVGVKRAIGDGKHVPPAAR
jgi:hypothetical protein